MSLSESHYGANTLRFEFNDCNSMIILYNFLTTTTNPTNTNIKAAR